MPVDGWHQPATDASISLDPGSGPPGTKVTVIGSGFPSQAKGAITWGSQSGSVLAEFTANPNGAFSTTFKVPSNASGGVKVWACTVPKLLIAAPICASRSFKVTAAEEPEATQAPVTPLLPTPVRTACDVRRIAGEVVVDFERFSEGENLRGVTLPEGVRFVGDIDLRAFSPVVATHSGSKAMRTDYAGDFGSGGAAVRLSFINLQDFVGMYVGLNERLWSTGPITAVLTAYALDASGSSVVAGMDSVSFGPAATPIRQCLSVSAPGIHEVTLTYGSAGEPEVLDDLIFRGPATPVPQPEDNQPPRVTLLMPEDGAILSNPSIRLQGEVRDDRELAELEYRVNLGDVHPLTFTPAGITPEGDHLYLFAVEPVPVDELRTCGDNLIDVVGRDTAGNTGMDAAGFQLYFGDLELEAAEAVQVVYGADLVREKGTAFRVRVGSTFDCPIQTRFLLELPEDQWSTAPVVSGGDHVALPPSWEYPDTWGLVTIPARARHFTVMLPYVPEGQETNGFGGATPAGLVHNLDGINPDVRVLPRPVAHPVRFGVAIDPGNSWPETDETNNRFDSGPYRVVTTRPYHFIAYQIHGGEGNAGCTAPMAEVEAAFHRSLEFVLATFPIADGKIGGEVDPFEQTWDFSTEDRCAFLARISRMTKENEGDFGVAMTCRGGGAECGDAVFVGAQRTQAETLAHEFNHVVVPMDDVYSKDCYCQWGERYCELPGDDKFYCCYDFSAKGHDYNQMRVTEEAMGVDPHQGCAVDCGQTEGDSCLDASGSDLCEAACDDAGGILRGCPDTLPTAERLLVASDGFWPNRWTPEEGKMYFMDGPSGDNWMIRESMQALGQPSCWDADGVGRNGFIDLLESDRFRYELDPAVLLVSGSVNSSRGSCPRSVLDPARGVHRPEARRRRRLPVRPNGWAGKRPIANWVRPDVLEA